MKHLKQCIGQKWHKRKSEKVQIQSKAQVWIYKPKWRYLDWLNKLISPLLHPRKLPGRIFFKKSDTVPIKVEIKLDHHLLGSGNAAFGKSNVSYSLR